MPKNTNILLIRHAEKPTGANDPTLAVAGQERAQAYVIYFQNFLINSEPVKLNYLFATAESSASNRPYLTIEPLANALGLSINNNYADKDYKSLAKEILQNNQYDNSDILICWHHGEILELAHRLGAPKDKLPSKWSGDVFGWLIHLVFDADGNLTVEPTRNEQLMYDDYGKNPPSS
ncbi:MAG TPA: hypothetical protein VF599_14290 [Pyrinomonadaceae bacterium]|jgi:phosphohistidine phosphatase SixA